MKSTKIIVSAMMVVALIATVAAFVVNRDDGGPAVASEEPAQVEPIEGSELSSVTLTQRAAERLGIQTSKVTEEIIQGATRLVVPYASVIYDTEGNTWVYTNPESLVFVREPIAVERIDGDIAIVSEGPGVGTDVVTVGGAMLYGTEVGVGH